MGKLFIMGLGLAAIVFTLSNHTYTVDKNHTRVGFSAKHFGISNVEGKFNSVEVTLTASKEDFTDASVTMIADVNSIDTDVQMRDNDLKSSKWLNEEKYKQIIFKSNAFQKISSGNYKLKGLITIHGISKPIVFDVIYNGKALNPHTGKNSIGFTVNGKINRLDFGIGTETSTAIVSNVIELKANAEFIHN